VIDDGSGAWTPGRSGMMLELLDGLVAEELHAVAAFDQRHALGDESLCSSRAPRGVRSCAKKTAPGLHRASLNPRFEHGRISCAQGQGHRRLKARLSERIPRDTVSLAEVAAGDFNILT
jgi:hypothetical protein